MLPIFRLFKSSVLNFLYAPTWFRIYCLVTSPLFLILLSLIFKWLFLLDEVDCYRYNGRIYVADRMNDDHYRYFDSWLVHTDYASTHFSLSQTQINSIINLIYPVTSPTMGEIYISEYYLQPTTWCSLIIHHPEMVHSGYTCIIDYNTHGQNYLGPRNPSLTVEEFLVSYCR